MPRSPLHPFPKSLVHPNSMNKLPLTSQQKSPNAFFNGTVKWIYRKWSWNWHYHPGDSCYLYFSESHIVQNLLVLCGYWKVDYVLQREIASHPKIRAYIKTFWQIHMSSTILLHIWHSPALSVSSLRNIWNYCWRAVYIFIIYLRCIDRLLCGT